MQKPMIFRIVTKTGKPIKTTIIFRPSNPQNTTEENYIKLIQTATLLGFETEPSIRRWFESILSKKNNLPNRHFFTRIKTDVNFTEPSRK